MLFNRVVGLGLREPATEAMLDDLVALYREAGVTKFAVQVSPAARPAELPAWLEARGLSARDNWAKVYRTATPPPEISTDLRIECIGPEHAETFAQVACTAFGMPLALSAMLVATIGRPGWRHYLAFDGDEAVATGALYVQGDVGWLGVGSTLPSHRRRGGQGASDGPAHSRRRGLGLQVAGDGNRRRLARATQSVLPQHAAHRVRPGLPTYSTISLHADYEPPA